MLETKLEKFTKILLYAIPFLVLIFISGFYFPFIITRTIFFRLVIQLAFSLYLLLLALNFKKYSSRFNWAFILVIIFFFIQLAAAIFGLDFYKSFWSNFERMEGLSSLIYLTLYLFLLQVFLRDRKDWLFYIRLILIASFFVSIYGLAQKLNIFPVFEAGIGRVTATIGNAAFLAGYLLVTAGLSIYYYFNEVNKNYKYAVLGIATLNVLVLFLTSTRGAILGLGLGILAFLFLNIIFLPGKVRKISLAILLPIIIIAGSFYFLRDNLADSKVEFVRRIATISLSDITVKNRLTVWRMALSDFKSSPVLGVGMENFNIIYNKYYRPDILENWFDRTHNVYLDQLTSGGILGFLAYLAILFYLFFWLFKNRREDYYKFSVLFSLLVAYSVHNFFVFDTLNTSFLYFFLIGLICFKENEAGFGGERSEPNNKAFNWLFIILIVLNLVVFYKAIYQPLKINRAIYTGYYYVIADTFRSYENFKEALNYKFGSVEAAVQLNKMLEVLYNQGSANEQTKNNYYELALEKSRLVSAHFPLEIKTKIYLGQLILNNYKEEKELDEAESLFIETIKLSPNRIEPHYLLYNVYLAKKEKQKARTVLENLVNQLPWYGGAKMMLMGDVYKDEPARAEELFKEGIKQFGYSDFGGLKKIIIYLLDQKRYAEVVPYYNDLIKAEPTRYDYRLDLIKIYYLIGDLDSAVEQLNIINSQSPETLKDYQDFVNEIYDAYNKS